MQLTTTEELRVVQRRLECLASWRLNGGLDAKDEREYLALCRVERKLLDILHERATPKPV